MEGGSEILGENLSLKEAAGLELEMTSYPVVTDSGTFLGRTMIFRDVTQAKAVQRMKSQFLVTASHQLRTPMSAIQTFAELSLSRDVTPSKRRHWLTLIQDQATRMVNTINSILNVSQIESGRLDLTTEEIDAREVCRTIIEDFESRSPDHMFELRIPEPAAMIRVDVSRFSQIVANLVDNAVKYSPGSSRVVIAADKDLDEMIRFQVSDTGVGIHAEGLRDLFVPFSRVSNGETTEVTGTGLGLYISKNLVELHHGKMWVESERGVGTTVKPKSTEGMTMQQRNGR